MTPQLLAAEMADAEQAALAEADQQFHLEHGADESSWTPQDEAEYLAVTGTVHAVFEAAEKVKVPESQSGPLLVLATPARKELHGAIREIIRCVGLVRVTPYHRSLGPVVQRLHTVMVLRTDGIEAALPRGAHGEIVRLLRGAMPDAPWDTVALDYGVPSGVLLPYEPKIPAYLREAS